ncbi:hypothetical protein L5M43_05130 [Shewanella sp. SW36]|jgi:hypothetical protein|uniref:hypothetical protein n=1 Tax=Shewanella TaxID=22 RepID=UPI001F58284C|nr:MULTISPECIES: hypothetical protein [unclassified Shewanella]MCI2962297.1 hypothetical protein [Shewanella sp. N2AIL]MCU7974656.1 hypothetical protein [Shewanella sp. SW36]MCU7990044.1 hypothetical protein [Shewanella sp. SW1]MCU8015327.1 hypothetical protein [Shewanella sp. SM72]MCU8051975.1 hypothetical protein [Shewanella sp. SM43]
MFMFLGWLILAILVGVYANTKGRSGVGFFLLAVILSPLIGFIIALVISPVKGVIEANAIQSGDMKKCPDCAELVKAEAKICKHCRAELA